MALVSTLIVTFLFGDIITQLHEQDSLPNDYNNDVKTPCVIIWDYRT